VETIDAILTRRSVRAFRDQPVEAEKTLTLLKAAMYAPSALNEQPWRFVVLTDRTLFARIMRVYPYAGMLASAPQAILVCGDLRLEKAPGNWVLDCAAATQNILLAAHAIGLGAVWSGIYPEADRMQALAEMLHLPGEVPPFALVAVGYADLKKPPPSPERFHLDRVCLNDWNSRYGV
jgi:nitroreductase